MSYEDKEEKSQAHPDAKANEAFYKMQMDRVLWTFPDKDISQTEGFSNPVRILLSGSGYNEGSEKILNEVMYVTFAYPTIKAKDLIERGLDLNDGAKSWELVKGSPRLKRLISFHQERRHFKLELCSILNHLGSLGYLEHKERNANGSPKIKPPPDRWGNGLFD